MKRDSTKKGVIVVQYLSTTSYKTTCQKGNETFTLDMVINTGNEGHAFFWHSQSPGSENCFINDDNGDIITEGELDYIEMMFHFTTEDPAAITYLDPQLNIAL